MKKIITVIKDLFGKKWFRISSLVLLNLIVITAVFTTVIIGFRYFQKSSEEKAETSQVQTMNVYINSIPEGAQIWIDGKDTGKNTPATVFNVQVGKRKLKLVKEEYQDFENTVEFTSKEKEGLTFELIASVGSDERERKVTPFSIFVRSDNVNFRDSDSKEGSIISTLSYKTELEVFGISRATGWYHARVKSDGKEGWITNDPKFVQRKAIYVYKYKNPDVDLTRTRVKIIYFLPGDQLTEDNWKEKIVNDLSMTKNFLEKEFNHQMTFNFDIYPEIVYGQKSTQFYTGRYYDASQSDYATLGDRIGDEIEREVLTLGGRYYNESFAKENPNEYTSYGIVGDGYYATFAKPYLSRPMFFVMNNYPGNYMTSIIAHEALHTFGLPDEHRACNPKNSLCPRKRNGKIEDYSCIMESAINNIAKMYIDDDLKMNMGINISS